MSGIRDIISSLYTMSKENKENINDTFLRNYYSGYCDALKAVDIILERREAEVEEKKKTGLVQVNTPAAEETPKKAAKAAEKKVYTKVCKDCGKIYQTTVKQRTYCTECVRKRKRESNRKSNKKRNGSKIETGADKDWVEHESKDRYKKTSDALNEAARIQKETGKSYGQQQAEEYWKTKRAMKGV